MVAGTHDLKVPRGWELVVHVTRLIIHEQYNASTFDNDIALLILNQSLILGGPFVRPVPLVDSEWTLPGERL